MKGNPEKTLAYRRSVALVAGKFLYDYKKQAKCLGETLEHYYEVWAPRNVVGEEMKINVWRVALRQIQE